MSGGYYVYTHVRLDTGEVFYVGKGKGGRAWSSCSGRNTESGWPISRCAKGFQKSAYGFKWRYPE